MRIQDTPTRPRHVPKSQPYRFAVVCAWCGEPFRLKRRPWRPIVFHTGACRWSWITAYGSVNDGPNPNYPVVELPR